MAYEKPTNPTRIPTTTYHAIPSAPTNSPTTDLHNVPPGAGGVPANAVIVTNLSAVLLNDGINYVVTT